MVDFRSLRALLICVALLIGPATCALAQQTPDGLEPRWECERPKGGLRVFGHKGYTLWRYPDETASFQDLDEATYHVEVNKLWVPNRKCALVFYFWPDSGLPKSVFTFREATLEDIQFPDDFEELLADYSDIEDCRDVAREARERAKDSKSKSIRMFAGSRAYRRCLESEIASLDRRGIVVVFVSDRPRNSSGSIESYVDRLVFIDRDVIETD